ERRHRAVTGDVRQMASLASRCGACVQDPCRAVRRGKKRYELGGLVLGLEQALLVSLDVQRRWRSRGEDQRIRAVPPWTRIDARRSQRFLCARYRSFSPRDADGRRRLLLVCRAELLCLG